MLELLLLGGIIYLVYQSNASASAPVNQQPGYVPSQPLPYDFGVTPTPDATSSWDTSYSLPTTPDTTPTPVAYSSPVDYLNTPPVTQPVSFSFSNALQSLIQLFHMPSSWDSYFSSAESNYGLPNGILKALAIRESTLNPNAVASGGKGLMQLNPRYYPTAGQNPVADISTAAAALAQYNNRFCNIQDALASYNLGPNAVASAGGVNGTPSSVQSYVRDILNIAGLVST